MGHGASLRSVNVAHGQQQSTAALDPAAFPGFSYLLGAPQPWQRSRWGDDLAATRDVMTRLVMALPEAADWPTPLKPGAHLDDNPFIPAGYTYLMQFVAHDLVRTETPLWQAAAQGTSSANTRAEGLMLDALYGRGPSACPVANKSAAADIRERSRLRLGRIAVDGDRQCVMRDLPPRTDGAQITDHAGRRIAATVQAADPRNNDNLTLAQLVVLFSLAHNLIADNVQPEARPEARFANARAIMLSIYHSIIRCDLLPRLLHPAVWRAMNERSASDEHWLWRDPGLPLEFSHGAFRTGHAMVCPDYTLNDRTGPQGIGLILRQSSATAGGTRMPLEADGVVQWSRFFTFGPPPNYSRRISPTRSSLDFQGLCPADDTSFPDSVIFRDLLSAAAARLWSVNAMIEAIMERAPDLIPVGWTFANPVRRRNVIAQWLTQIRRLAGVLTDDDIESLADDPPLPLFILLEAGLDPILRGRCLGVLGSVIVGEVIFRRLAMERGRLEMLRTAAQSTLPPGLAAAVAEIDSMPGLVQFVARFGGLDRCAEMPFI
ncbi:MAG TPA: peroxidase family protein [Acetobacteraceae bacterium]|nr:peroxidase family protein [Acetobacteraceae bacterium]